MREYTLLKVCGIKDYEEKYDDMGRYYEDPVYECLGKIPVPRELVNNVRSKLPEWKDVYYEWEAFYHGPVNPTEDLEIYHEDGKTWYGRWNVYSMFTQDVSDPEIQIRGIPYKLEDSYLGYNIYYPEGYESEVETYLKFEEATSSQLIEVVELIRILEYVYECKFELEEYWNDK